MCWEAAAKKGLSISDDLAVAGVKEDPQPIAAAGANDVSVAEIEAKQLRVIRHGKQNRLAGGAPASRTDHSDQLAGLILCATPVTHRRPRQPEAPRHLAVVLPCLDERKRSVS